MKNFGCAGGSTLKNFEFVRSGIFEDLVDVGREIFEKFSSFDQAFDVRIYLPRFLVPFIVVNSSYRDLYGLICGVSVKPLFVLSSPHLPTIIFIQEATSQLTPACEHPFWGRI